VVETHERTFGVNAFPGVFRASQRGKWGLRLPDKGFQSFESENEAAVAYRDWLAHNNKQPRTITSQYRGEPPRADVTVPALASTPEPAT
jgi:hypothetical protein